MSSSPTEIASAEVLMPQMGVSVAEGTIVEWLKSPGDPVEADETVCVVSTDKTDVEIPAPSSGVIAEILVEVDATVPVGTALARIGAPGAQDGHGSSAEGAEKTSVAGEGAGPQDEPAGIAEPDRSGFISPVVRRIAEEHAVDLARIEGTGIGGRIRKRDVLAFVDAGNGNGNGGGAVSDAPAERPLHTESPYRPDEPEAPEPEPDAAADAGPAPSGDSPGDRREPMSPMRSAIARHMTESRRTAAHCTTVVEADMSAVAATRSRLKEPLAERGVPLTYLAFVAQAVVAELQRFPQLNASVDGEEIVTHADVNLGIAVALEPGLIVPVIHRAQRLSLEGMAAAIAEVAERARAGRLAPEETGGGTFTITNPGQFGAVLATPIINQPEVAILDLEAIVKRPVVIEGPEGDAIAIRPMTNLCMSWDHRALDGADAARFLGAVRSRLESWREDA